MTTIFDVLFIRLSSKLTFLRIISAYYVRNSLHLKTQRNLSLLFNLLLFLWIAIFDKNQYSKKANSYSLPLPNNVRFLILPDVHIPNLASKILSLNLKRLSRDWEEVYGHPIVLAETFVDATRFRGTCYRASGWIPLGQTRGFRRSGGKYYAHGKPKIIYIRPLRQDVRRLLSEPLSNTKLFKEEGIVNIKAISIDNEGGLIEHLKSIPEPRKARGIRHRKISILAVSICAILSGAKSFAAIGEWAGRCTQNMLKRLWCRRDTETKLYAPPSEPTVRRLLQQIDAQAVDKAINQRLFTQAHCSEADAVALDGKTLKGSRVRDSKPVHLLRSCAKITSQALVELSQL